MSDVRLDDIQLACQKKEKTQTTESTVIIQELLLPAAQKPSYCAM
jgi:hypothetical protein